MAEQTRRDFFQAAEQAQGLLAGEPRRSVGQAPAAPIPPAAPTHKKVPQPPAFDAYYDSVKGLGDYFCAHARQMGMRATSRAELEAWTSKARAKFVELLALDRLEAADPQARQIGAVDCGSYVRESWLMQTQRDVIMPFYLLRPKGLKGPAPAVICPHGHGSAGKEAVAGVRDIPEVAEIIPKNNWTYGVEMAEAGLVAICPDARGHGQRQEERTRSKTLAYSCAMLQVMGLPQGLPVIGMWTFDLICLLNYLQQRDDIAADRIGCAGLSGGGWQTLALSAVDTRVRCAVVSGYFYGVAESLLELPSNCACNILPRMWENFDMGDLGAMIAPRPLLIESGDQDHLNGKNGVNNARSQVEIAAGAYRLLDAGDRLYHDVFSGTHMWHGLHAVPWMKKWLTD